MFHICTPVFYIFVTQIFKIIEMKKVYLCLALFSASFAFGQGQISFYGGLNLAGASSKDFTQFDISDWENYGLLTNGGAEGRVTVDLAANKPSPINLGINLGAEYSLNEKFSALAELQYAVSGISLLGVYAGINYDVVKKEKFSLGLTPKIGYNVGGADLGTVSVLPGYVPPVVLPEGTFNDGDALSIGFSGLAINLGIRPRYMFTEKIGLHSLIGFNLGLTSSDGLVATTSGGDVVIPMTSAAVVKSDASATQAGINPTMSSTGLSLQLGIVFKL